MWRPRPHGKGVAARASFAADAVDDRGTRRVGLDQAMSRRARALRVGYPGHRSWRRDPRSSVAVSSCLGPCSGPMTLLSRRKLTGNFVRLTKGGTMSRRDCRGEGTSLAAKVWNDVAATTYSGQDGPWSASSADSALHRGVAHRGRARCPVSFCEELHDALFRWAWRRQRRTSAPPEYRCVDVRTLGARRDQRPRRGGEQGLRWWWYISMLPEVSSVASVVVSTSRSIGPSRQKKRGLWPAPGGGIDTR